MTPTPQTEPPEWDDCLQSPQAARLQIAHELNQLFRRFRQYEKEADWVRLVMEGAANYARQAALFAVQSDAFQLRGAVNFDLTEDLRLEAKHTAAFEAVLLSKEPVTALRTNGEVGAALSSPGRLAYLFPILNGSRVAAILLTNAEDSEVDQLELLANMAASALERQTNSGLHAQIAPLAEPRKRGDTPGFSDPSNSTNPAGWQRHPYLYQGVSPLFRCPPESGFSGEPQRTLPPWANMPADQRALHSQAARFARVTVAEMQLLKPAACRTASQKGDLYVVLGTEIDKAREIYRQRFMILPSMVDYFHRELIGSILRGDSTKLGADYPGELA